MLVAGGSAVKRLVCARKAGQGGEICLARNDKESAAAWHLALGSWQRTSLRPMEECPDVFFRLVAASTFLPSLFIKMSLLGIIADLSEHRSHGA